MTVYSVMEQRVVAWCEGHTSWVTAVGFDPWYAGHLQLPGCGCPVPQNLLLLQCLHVWGVRVMVSLQAASCAACNSLYMSRNAQGHAANDRPGFGQVNKQHRNGGRQQRSTCTCTGRGSASSRYHIPCGLACAGLPHLYVGRHHPRLALASAPCQVRHLPGPAACPCRRPSHAAAERLQARFAQGQLCGRHCQRLPDQPGKPEVLCFSSGSLNRWRPSRARSPTGRTAAQQG